MGNKKIDFWRFKLPWKKTSSGQMGIFGRFRNIPKRYFVTFLLFLSNFLEGFVLTNMSVVIIDITSDKKIPHNNVTTIIKVAEHPWTSIEVGFVLGMNSIGQIFGSIFSGLVVHRIGGATFLGLGKLGEAVISLTSPFMIDTNVHLFMGHRLVLGLFEGLSFVGCTDALTHWIPPKYRVRLVTLIFMGYELGGACNYPVSGFIIQHFGWRMVFYTCGATMLVWSTIWILSVSNDPSTDRFITEEEKSYLSREINYISREKVDVVPYKSILTSIPVYALLNEIFCSSFTGSFLLLLPLYVKDLIDTDIQTIGLLSGVPYYITIVIKPFGATFIDYLRAKPGGYGISRIHKWLLFWGQSCTLAFFFASAMWNNIVFCAICITLAKVSYGLCMISYNVLEVDVAGQYAGFLKSMTQVVRSGTGFLNSLLIGLLIPNHIQSEWNTYFLVITFLTIFGVVVFVIFGSGDLQPWAQRVPPKKDTKDDLEARE